LRQRAKGRPATEDDPAKISQGAVDTLG
jgi:hypothetical protein